MSTLNVANISDDQSTLSNSANPNDDLNNTTTVDTKYVTNGCAKAYALYTDSVLYGSLNVSSVSSNSLGDNTINITNNMAADTYQVSLSGGSSNQVHVQMYYEGLTSSCSVQNQRFNGTTFSDYNVKAAFGIVGDLA